MADTSTTYTWPSPGNRPPEMIDQTASSDPLIGCHLGLSDWWVTLDPLIGWSSQLLQTSPSRPKLRRFFLPVKKSGNEGTSSSRSVFIITARTNSSFFPDYNKMCASNQQITEFFNSEGLRFRWFSERKCKYRSPWIFKGRNAEFFSQDVKPWRGWRRLERFSSWWSLTVFRQASVILDEVHQCNLIWWVGWASKHTHIHTDRWPLCTHSACHYLINTLITVNIGTGHCCLNSFLQLQFCDI